MKNSIFNTPFELGVRMIYLLSSFYPDHADLQRLIYYDYAAIYSADLGGPESLHTPVPLRGGEFASRREVIEEGLYLMSLRSFVDVQVGSSGITYCLGENGPTLIGIIGGEYSKELQKRCAWVAESFGYKTDKEMEEIFLKNGVLWGAEFVSLEQTGVIE